MTQLRGSYSDIQVPANVNTLLTAANPRRQAITIINAADGNLRVGIGQAAGVATGMLVRPTGTNYITLGRDEIGDLIGLDFYAYMTAASDVVVLESFF